MTFFIHRKIFSLSISQSKVHATKIAGVVIRRKRRCLPIAHTTYVACKEADTLVGSESSGGQSLLHLKMLGQQQTPGLSHHERLQLITRAGALCPIISPRELKLKSRWLYPTAYTLAVKLRGWTWSSIFFLRTILLSLSSSMAASNSSIS